MENVIAKKSYAFAIRIIRLYKFLIEDKKEFILSKQLLRSGTAIGALIKEAEHAQSKSDFLNKMNVALKEANETEYWLMLLKDTAYIGTKEFDSMKADCTEILKLLISIVKSTKTSLNK
jgi:four helix bundle protein